jgi:hypothetical protein
MKLFLNSKLNLIQTVKFVKQVFRIQIQKSRKVLLWDQVKFIIEACYSELVLHSMWLSAKLIVLYRFMSQTFLKAKPCGFLQFLPFGKLNCS